MNFKLYGYLLLLLLFFTTSGFCADVTITVVDAKGNPVSDAVVILSGKQLINTNPTPTPAVISQIHKEFIPKVTVIQTGSDIAFPNQDSISHHVYSFSKAKKFEIPLYKGKDITPITFEKPGVVSIGCNIHDWMKAWIYVTDSSFFSKTDATGKITFQNLPIGEITIETWHPNKMGRGNKKQNLTITNSSQTVSVMLTLKKPWNPSRAPMSTDSVY